MLDNVVVHSDCAHDCDGGRKLVLPVVGGCC